MIVNMKKIVILTCVDSYICSDMKLTYDRKCWMIHVYGCPWGNCQAALPKRTISTVGGLAQDRHPDQKVGQDSCETILRPCWRALKPWRATAEQLCAKADNNDYNQCSPGQWARIHSCSINKLAKHELHNAYDLRWMWWHWYDGYDRT